jgi:rare lipoprotein A
MRQVVFAVAFFWGVWTAIGAQGPSETGLASWYGAPYHGQRSASGEIYDQEKLTAAHRMLPFGTRVRVRRLDRDSSVVVRINDRGPFLKSRIIDVSHAAAVQLEMTDGGVAPVILELVDMSQVAARNTLLVGSASIRNRGGGRVQQNWCPSLHVVRKNSVFSTDSLRLLR